LEAWYATGTWQGSITITISFTSSHSTAGVAFGISGANTTSPFDGSAITGKGTSATTANVSISTTYANDFIIGTLGLNSNPTPKVGNGFANIAYNATSSRSSRETADEYEILSKTQSNLAVSYSWSGNQNWAMIANAIKEAQ
jgi:hypothetical protein